MVDFACYASFLISLVALVVCNTCMVFENKDCCWTCWPTGIDQVTLIF